MPITVRCACGESLHADERHAGRTARCRCGRTLTIPAAPPPPPPARPTHSRRPGRPRPPFPIRLRSRWTDARNAFARRPPLHWSERAAWGYLLLSLLAAAALPTLGDRWWPVTVFLFGPRWVLLLPLLALVPIALRWRPKALGPLGLGALVVLGPVMGWHLGWRGLLGGSRDLRVVSYNVANGSRIELGPALELWEADVVALQECGGALSNHVRAMARTTQWHTHVFHDLCLLTRLPIVATDTFTGFRYGGGWGGLVTRHTLQAGDRSLTVVNLHFDTPRRGLERVRAGGGVRELTTNLRLRSDAMRHARTWLGPMPGPVVVAGDFNTPSESAIFREHWGDFDDAFEEAGRGYGGTRVLRRYRVRIDHLLSAGAIVPTHVEVGGDLGSDHLPVIGDFAWE